MDTKMERSVAKLSAAWKKVNEDLMVAINVARSASKRQQANYDKIDKLVREKTAIENDLRALKCTAVSQQTLNAKKYKKPVKDAGSGPKFKFRFFEKMNEDSEFLDNGLRRPW
jgi:hypothetical protein